MTTPSPDVPDSIPYATVATTAWTLDAMTPVPLVTLALDDTEEPSVLGRDPDQTEIEVVGQVSWSSHFDFDAGTTDPDAAIARWSERFDAGEVEPGELPEGASVLGLTATLRLVASDVRQDATDWLQMTVTPALLDVVFAVPDDLDVLHDIARAGRFTVDTGRPAGWDLRAVVDPEQMHLLLQNQGIWDPARLTE